MSDAMSLSAPPGGPGPTMIPVNRSVHESQLQFAAPNIARNPMRALLPAPSLSRGTGKAKARQPIAVALKAPGQL